MLKEKKLKLERKLDKEITWDYFFNKIEIKIKHSNGMEDGKTTYGGEF
jgi:hypothetical protein